MIGGKRVGLQLGGTLDGPVTIILDAISDLGNLGLELAKQAFLLRLGSRDSTALDPGVETERLTRGVTGYLLSTAG